MFGLVEQIQQQLRDIDMLVLQYPRYWSPSDLPGQGYWYRQRKYGKTRIGLWQAVDPDEAAAIGDGEASEDWAEDVATTGEE